MRTQSRAKDHPVRASSTCCPYFLSLFSPIPLIAPTIRTWVFLSMIGSLQLFDMVWIMTGGGPANATTTMATYLIGQGSERQNFGIAGAASVILFVIGFVMALLYQLLVLRRDTQPDR